MLGKPVCSRFFILQPCSVVIGYHYERHVMPPDQTLRLLSTRYVRGKEAFPPWSLKDSQRAFDPFRMLVSSSSVRGSRAPLRLFLVRDRSSQVNEAVYRRRFAVHPCVSRFIIFVSLFFNVSSFFRRILEQKWREINRESVIHDTIDVTGTQVGSRQGCASARSILRSVCIFSRDIFPRDHANCALSTLR